MEPVANKPSPAPTHWFKRALPWAIYDWANSAFALTVMAVFVPVLNKDYWSAGTADTVSTFRLSAANSSAAILVALMAPALGAIADRGGARKRFLAFFAFLGVLATAGLGIVGQGQWGLALTLYTLGCIGFSGGNVFYDSLMVAVADPDKFDLVSALGYALGYVGSGFLFAGNIYMILHPQTFGLRDAAQATQIAFFAVALWWALFALPLLLKVREPVPAKPPGSLGETVAAGFRQLAATFREVRKLRAVFLFLLGYWLYIDGVDTIVQMAVDYGKSLKFESSSLMTALLITQFVGFPAAIAFGKLGQKVGARRAILGGLGVYVGVCIYGYFMDDVRDFYVLAAIVGLVQGGVQSLSRSFYARLIPADKAGEFFGFYNMLGKFAAILGPILMSTVALKSGNPRLGILAVIILFVAGGVLLALVPAGDKRGA